MSICDARISKAEIDLLRKQIGNHFNTYSRMEKSSDKEGEATFEVVGLYFQGHNIELRNICPFVRSDENEDIEIGVFKIKDFLKEKLPSDDEGWNLVKYPFDEKLCAIEITTEKVVAHTPNEPDLIEYLTPTITLIGETKKLVIMRCFSVSDSVYTYCVDKNTTVEKPSEWNEPYEGTTFDVTVSIDRFE